MAWFTHCDGGCGVARDVPFDIVNYINLQQFKINTRGGHPFWGQIANKNIYDLLFEDVQIS